MASITREFAGRLVAVEIALDSYAATKSDDDRQDLMAALDELLPQAQVVGLTVPEGAFRNKFDVLSTTCSNYRRRLRQPLDPSLNAAESTARQAIKNVEEAIQARFNTVKDRR